MKIAILNIFCKFLNSSEEFKLKKSFQAFYCWLITQQERFGGHQPAMVKFHLEQFYLETTGVKKFTRAVPGTDWTWFLENWQQVTKAATSLTTEEKSKWPITMLLSATVLS